MQKFVARIFFDECIVERPIYGGFFRLPAVPRESPPFLILIHDHTQWEPQPFISGGKSIPRLVMGEHIARDIYEHTATMGMGMSVDCGPGIWVVRDSVPWVNEENIEQPSWRPASDEEKQEMFNEDLTNAILRQQRYGQFLISQGDGYDKNPKERILITNRMRAAVRYYDREREWLQTMKDGDLKLCAYCMKSIDARAIKCPSCNEIVDAAKHAVMLAQRKRLEKEAIGA